ncbi:PH domain-containing protein [Favolaschia claudopus]|uniref:PH domain-containing protein n=1 Tax=Favolaschia claudopus TaxID=2862362 RepID=A0AAW0DAS9_9AGAR
MRVRGGAGVVRDEGYWEGEVGDSSGWEGTGGRGYARSGGGGGGGSGSGSGSRARSTGRGGGDEGYGGGFGGRGGGGWAGGGDDGDDRRGRDPRSSSFSTPSDSESESDSEDDESEDDYGEPSTANNNAAHNAPANNAGDGSDDDIPLAQRIPSALTAQKTIRRKVREERDQRRRERAARRAAGEDTRSRQTTLRPAGAGDASHAVAESSSREAARQAEAAMARAARQRTQTLPGNGPTQSAAVDDLTKKLQSMQQQTRQRTLTINTAAGGSSPVPMPMKSPRLVSASASPPAESGGRGLRPMRSFHRPATAGGVESSNVPLPQDAGAPARRSTTRHAQRAPRERGLTMPAFLSEPPPSPLPSAAAPSHKLTKTRPSGETFSIPPRTSGEAPSQTHKHVSSKSAGTLTRVFIGDMQRFNMIDITPATSAKHVLTMVDEQGSLKGWVGSGGWMVWEVCQDFGMERPIRSFELLADVQASWNMDKMVNTFIIKLTPLAPTLSRSNIPSSAPVYSGFVDWEMKRGKWTKRYLRLREHSLFLSKRESNKDEVFLCSLSNFDAYTVTRLHKAPKPFVFAVKSTDNLSFFENTADYLHIFACNQSEGEKWMERILLARSYVLYQERNVLFNPKSPAGNAASSAVPGLSRAPTRKIAAPSPRPPGQQPLVTVSPLLNAPDRNDVFAPGSLLHKSPAGTPATQ